MQKDHQIIMIPNLFYKTEIPVNIPKNIEKEISKIKKTKSKQVALEKAWDIIKKRDHGRKLQTYLLVHHLWKTPNQIFNTKGFLHCSNINYLFRTLLIKSNKFKESDIKLSFSMVYYISLHQYLKIKTEKGWIIADPWGASYGLKLGQYSSGFNV